MFYVYMRLKFRLLFYSYKNRPKMTFDEADGHPDQEFELHRDPTGVLEYSTK